MLRTRTRRETVARWVGMSVATLEAPVGTDERVARGRSPVWALGQAEGRKLVQHPVFVTGALASVVAFVISTRDQAPVLQRDDIVVGGALLPLAAATFLVANLLTLRSRRLGTDELFESTATTVRARTAAHLLSVSWAMATASLLVLGAMLPLIALGSVGKPSATELATGPFIVGASGILGVFLARWLPSPAGGPIGLVVLAAVEIWLNVTWTGGQVVLSRARWLAPWVSISNLGDPPRELVVRPLTWHLAYLLGIAVLAAALALMRLGVRLATVAVVATSLAVTVMAAGIQTRGPSAAQRMALNDLMAHPERFQTCRTVGSVRYCAYPGYVGWIDRWDRVIGPVVSAVPRAAVPGDLRVQQSFAFAYGGDVSDETLARLGTNGRGARIQIGGRTAITVGSDWRRGTEESGYEFDLALGMAGWIVGLPVSASDVRLTRQDVRALLEPLLPTERLDARQTIHAGAVYPDCDASRQARTVIALWLASQATAGSEAWLRDATRRPLIPEGTTAANWISEENGAGSIATNATRLQAGGDLSYVVGTPWFASLDDGDLALQLLTLPRSDVVQVLNGSWSRLVDPSTPSTDLIGLFGLAPPPTFEQRLRGAGLDATQAAAVEAARDTSYQVPCR